MNFYGITDTGKVRTQNQDVFRTEYSEAHQAAVLVVCDGMGGARAGNIASSMAADIFTDAVRGQFDCFTDPDTIAAIAVDAVKTANLAVYRRSCDDERCRGMGTTLVALIVSPKGNLVVNVGDSRAYHVGGGVIRQITNDHSVVAELISSGKITKAEARNHPNRNLITRAIGTTEMIQADVFHVPMKRDDYILLCSDGLSNIVGDQEFLFELMAHQDDISKVCDALIDLALDRGAPDNVTAVIYQN